MTLDTRTKIIGKAAALFVESGIKGITMDELAEHLGMSKRTIYEHFADKKELVKECVIFIDNKKDELAKDAVKHSKNVIETLLTLHLDNLKMMGSVNRKFADDIKKFYPELHNYFQEKRESSVYSTINFLQKGVEEGVVRDDQNVEIYANLLHEEMYLLFDNRSIHLSEFSVKEVYSVMFLCFLRGIATNKGLAVIDDFLMKNKNVYLR
ncbi:MAG: TetR/AcrR family transcriptional regulator [Paludibacteraceae bacterium]|jgi:AcrR family transcriptional regulator|nr:TetR/AcrR family transcriptional regulator [Paludibacteraceae bacterium]MEE0996390.1 TetR/AcrR family transcriptional regulator [Paludibacteraceae bacterium]MEE1541378.1 TetR/AcrR family transcriptional regulator [Paludibacteraceae bacterium]